MTGVLFLLELTTNLPDPDTVIGAADKNSWIGFATIMGTIILGIIRQELQARSVKRKAEETQKEVKQSVAVAVDTQAAMVQEHKEELKNIIKENAAVVAVGDARKANQYESAVLWREYVDGRLNALTDSVNELSAATNDLRSIAQRLINNGASIQQSSTPPKQ